MTDTTGRKGGTIHGKRSRAELCAALDRAEAAEAEVAALREARGVRVKPLVWDGYKTTDAIFHYCIHVGYGLLEGCFALTLCGIPVGEYSSEETAKAAAQADYERRILAALEPAPVTAGEAARVLLDATPSELDRGINALHIAANSDHGADVCLAQALRALADAGEAG